MNKSLRFSHKILLAASLIVILAFSLFTLYNDYLQRNAIREDLENYLAEMGASTSTNIRNLFDGRIKLVENLAQNIAQDPTKACRQCVQPPCPAAPQPRPGRTGRLLHRPRTLPHRHH